MIGDLVQNMASVDKGWKGVVQYSVSPWDKIPRLNYLTERRSLLRRSADRVFTFRLFVALSPIWRHFAQLGPNSLRREEIYLTVLGLALCVLHC